MKTINIKGEEYVPVNERVKHFLQNYEGWHITTEALTIEPEFCVFKAYIYDEKNLLKATGHAEEQRNASNINKTSYVENCETSAVGRALGFLGIGIDASIATADEVQNAIEVQNSLAQKINKNHLAALKLLCEEKGSDVEKVFSYYGCNEETMTVDQWQSAMNQLNKKK